MTNKELIALCKEYQKALKMSDWKISVSFVDSISGGCSGEAEFEEESQIAKIKVIRKRNYKGLEYDPWQILMHELLHCKFASVNTEDNPLFEQAIDSTARAILDLLS